MFTPIVLKLLALSLTLAAMVCEPGAVIVPVLDHIDQSPGAAGSMAMSLW